MVQQHAYSHKLQSIRSWWWWMISLRWGFGKAQLLVAVESDSWCTDPPALWTPGSFGWGWLGGCLFCQLPVSFLCGIMPLCLKLIIALSHRWVPLVSALGHLLPWLMVDSSYLCKPSFKLVFVMLSGSTMIVLFFLELTKKTVLSMHIICLLSLWCHKPSAIEFETRWTLCLADWLSWGLLHLIRVLAIWCQGWNANSVGEITVVARSASSRGPWFPCCTRV